MFQALKDYPVDYCKDKIFGKAFLSTKASLGSWFACCFCLRLCFESLCWPMLVLLSAISQADFRDLQLGPLQG